MANISGTKCPKCGHTSFELVRDCPTNSNHDMYYIRCSSFSCHTFLHAIPLADTNYLIEETKKSVERRISGVENNIGIVNENIGRVVALIKAFTDKK